MHARRILHLSAAAALAAPGTAPAQPVVWLDPGAHTILQGGELGLRLVSREPDDAPGAGAPVPWASRPADWVFIRAAGTQENGPGFEPDAPGGDTSSFRVLHPGVTMIGLELRPVISEFDAEALRGFVRTHTADRALPAALAAVPAGRRARVRRVETAVALVRAAPRGEDGAGGDPNPATAVSKAGLPVEIRLLADPTTTPVGADVPLRTYTDGGAARSVKVTATNLPSGAAQTFTTDALGIGRFRVTHAGAWRVEFHHAAPPAPPVPGAGGEAHRDGPGADPEGADLVLQSATVTFETPANAEDHE